MYGLNCVPRTAAPSTPSAPSAPSAATPSSTGPPPAVPHASTSTSTSSAFTASSSDCPSTQSLTDNLISHLSQLSTQSQSRLPPNFITAFVQKCFPSHLPRVDFPQALTGLDYLKDLETRRRRECASAMKRLGIDRDALEQRDGAALSPRCLRWVKAAEEKERKVDQLYTQIYVGLRRWILINELSLQPFHKHNCVAMLNTLYPPAAIAEQTAPTTLLTPAVLQSQRDGFFKYIQAVETNGPRMLTNLLQQGKGPLDVNGWEAVVRNLSIYLQVANSMINECMQVANDAYAADSPRNSQHARKADSGASFGSNVEAEQLNRKKVDSGISFGSAPSTENLCRLRGDSTTSFNSVSGVEQRPTTCESNHAAPTTSSFDLIPPKTPSGGRRGTGMERLARGLRSMGRSRTDVTEMIYDHGDALASPPLEKSRPLLKKMRSLGALSERKSSGLGSRPNYTTPVFDVEAMRKERAAVECRMAFDISS